MNPNEAEAAALHDARYSGELGGTDLGRILALSDGIFAFAMTLMVIYLVPPLSLDTFGHDVNGPLQAYVIGFMVLGVWWSSHHRIFMHIKRWDRYLMWTNLVLLMTIAVQPFFINVWIKYLYTTTAGVAYSACEAVTSLLFAAVWLQASWGHRLVHPELSAAAIRGTTERVALTPVVFGVAIIVAFLQPAWTMYVFIAIFPLQFFFRKVRDPARLKPPASLPGTPRAGE